MCVCVNSHLLMLNYMLISSAKAPMYPASSLTSLEQSLRAVWQAAIPSYSAQYGHWRKHNSQLLSCAILVRATQPKHPVMAPDKRGKLVKWPSHLNEHLLGIQDVMASLKLGNPKWGPVLPCLLSLDRRQETQHTWESLDGKLYRRRSLGKLAREEPQAGGWGDVRWGTVHVCAVQHVVSSSSWPMGGSTLSMKFSR